MMKGVFRSVAGIIVLMVLSFPVRAQEENFIAVSIYNFTRYIDWPANNTANVFTIDVIGHKSIYEKLKDLVETRRVGNLNMVVRYLESVSQVTQSEILFVGFWQSKDIAKAIEKVGNKNTLIVTEKDGMIENGSAINFVIRNDVIKFEIKRGNIEKYGLKVGESLINLAYKSY
jgi:hypothetical protein